MTIALILILYHDLTTAIFEDNFDSEKMNIYRTFQKEHNDNFTRFSRIFDGMKGKTTTAFILILHHEITTAIFGDKILTGEFLSLRGEGRGLDMTAVVQEAYQ